MLTGLIGFWRRVFERAKRGTARSVATAIGMIIEKGQLLKGQFDPPAVEENIQHVNVRAMLILNLKQTISCLQRFASVCSPNSIAERAQSVG